MRLKIKVAEVKGTCPVYHFGDTFTIEEGYILRVVEEHGICMHALASIMPYYVALSKGVKPVTLGLAKKDDGRAYVQCLNPCDYTGGGTVVFQIEREE